MAAGGDLYLVFRFIAVDNDHLEAGIWKFVWILLQNIKNL